MRGNSEICMLTVFHSEQSMFRTVCDDTDGVLMAVMAVMAGIETAKHHGHITSDRVTDLRHMCRKSHRSFVRILSQVHGSGQSVWSGVNGFHQEVSKIDGERCENNGDMEYLSMKRYGVTPTSASYQSGMVRANWCH